MPERIGRRQRHSRTRQTHRTHRPLCATERIKNPRRTRGRERTAASDERAIDADGLRALADADAVLTVVVKLGAAARAVGKRIRERKFALRVELLIDARLLRVVAGHHKAKLLLLEQPRARHDDDVLADRRRRQLDLLDVVRMIETAHTRDFWRQRFARRNETRSGAHPTALLPRHSWPVA